MTKEFDKLISSAAPAVPESGESRRRTRALLKERRRAAGQRRTLVQRAGMATAATVVFLLAITGQVSDLGSDGFDFTVKDRVLGSGDTLTMAVGDFKQYATNVPVGWTDDDVYEARQQHLLREGTVEELNGYGFSGEPPYLEMQYRRTTDGKTYWSGHLPEDMSVPNAPMYHAEQIPFLIEHSTQFSEDVENGLVAGRFYAKIQADGFTFAVYRYDRHYEGVGLVSYYRGLPVER